ncbi:uncharacterized protein METZ01_LOCUS354648, partial [marine metagenome]
MRTNRLLFLGLFLTLGSHPVSAQAVD